jgi:hypothetical protein
MIRRGLLTHSTDNPMQKSELSPDKIARVSGIEKTKRIGMRMCHFPRRLQHPRLVKSVEWYFQSRQDFAVSVAKLRKIRNLTYLL